MFASICYDLLLLFPLTCGVVALASYIIRSTKRSVSYPPGPKPWPIIGNALDIPSSKPWKVYLEWSRLYGEDLVHFEVFGQHMMIVNSRELAHELFDKRSLIYSDRPQVPMIDLMGWTRNGFTFMPYGSTWRQHRRLFQDGFRDPATSYLPILTAKTHELLLNLLNDSGNFRDHIRTLTAAIIMGIVYGHDVTSADDHFVTLAEKANETLLTLGATGASVVNMFPFMRHFPAWLPGCGFQRSAREARNRIESMVEEPYTLVVDQINSGVQKPSFLARYLERYRTDSGDDEQELLTIKRVCALAYAAGADTTISALAAFFIAMASYPHVQERAQEHIDNLLGNERLPAWEDRPKLQYIEAIIREVLRWRPIAPLGLFHAAMNDDTVNGYFVPKGTYVSGNIWAMSRDPNLYPDPETFIPERFLTEDGIYSSDASFTFGFGRRICAGRHLAVDTLWVAMACILATFNISKAKDEAGNDIEVDDVEYNDGIVINPGPFPCTITPRSARARALLAEITN